MPVLKRLCQLAIIGGMLLCAAGIAWLACTKTAVSFLAPRTGANWIVYPKPPVPHLQAVAELPTLFRRTFNLDATPVEANLSILACRRFNLWVNGVPLGTRTNSNWKKSLSVQVGGAHLRPGTNTILVAVWNSVGPPALWLRSDARQLPLKTDGSWEASYAGAVWQPAQLAGDPPAAGPGNPFKGAPSIAATFQRSWPVLVVLTVLSSLLFAASRWRFARQATLAGSRLAWIRSAPAMLMAAVAVLWVLLFTHNLALIPGNVGFDTDGHLEYIQYIQKHAAVPPADTGWETHQPPLFYLLSAALLSLFGVSATSFDGVAILRIFLLAIALLHLWVIFASLRILFPESQSKQAAGLALVGFLPIQLYLGQYITNETLAACLVSAALYLVLRLLHSQQPSWKLFAAIGMVLGLAMLTKVTAILFAPFVGAALVYYAFKQAGRAAQRVAMLSLTIVTCVGVSGWHYFKMWIQHGHPLFVPTRWAYGVSWWQDPGYHTGGYFNRFGRALEQPFFSGLSSFGDGLYSTLWGDGLCGGASAWSVRPPWNYELMNIGFVLALVPAVLILIGCSIALARAVGKPDAIWAGLVGFTFVVLLAIVHLNLAVPSYAVAKSFYGMSALAALAAFAGAGWGVVERVGKVARSLVVVALIAWALASYGSFWIDKRSATTQALVARGLLRSGNHTGGIAQLRRVLAQDPGHTAARSFLLNALLRERNLVEAAPIAAEGIRLSPESAQAHLDLAAARELGGDLGQALTVTARAVELAPDHPEARLSLAARLFKLRRYPESISACREALRLSPADPELHLTLGFALSVEANGANPSPAAVAGPFFPPDAELASLNDTLMAEAIHHLRLCLRLSPNLPDALNHLAWLLASWPNGHLRDGVEALRLAQRACALTSGRNANMLRTLAVAYAETGQFESALHWLDQAEKVTGAGAEALGIDRRLRELFIAQAPFRQGPSATPGQSP